MSGMLATGTAGALVAGLADCSLVIAAGELVAVAIAVSLPAAFMAGALLSAAACDELGMPAFAAAGVLVADSVGAIWLVPSALVWDKAVCCRTSPPNRTAIISFFIMFVCFGSVNSNFFVCIW